MQGTLWEHVGRKCSPERREGGKRWSGGKKEGRGGRKDGGAKGGEWALIFPPLTSAPSLAFTLGRQS